VSEAPAIRPLPVPDALAAVVAAPRGLLALGMPGCAACLLLPASLAEVARTRPGLTVEIGEFASVEDWSLREELLWPRGIHVSRASVPALALLVAGEVVATRPGGGPAAVIDAWLAETLGQAAAPIGPGPTPAELAALEGLSGLIARHRSVKGRRDASLGVG
jgi:hypothetical protein